ncbi:hypothetical protein CR513_22478, partial [Mucuna pruriens]
MNLHSEFPSFDDFTNCNYTCIGLTKCLIYAKISNTINIDVKPPKDLTLELLRWIRPSQAIIDRSRAKILDA